MQYVACALPAGYLALHIDTQVVQYSLLSHYNNGCTNAPQCYVIQTLPLSFIQKKHDTSRQKSVILFQMLFEMISSSFKILQHESRCGFFSALMFTELNRNYEILYFFPLVVTSIRPFTLGLL